MTVAVRPRMCLATSVAVCGLLLLTAAPTGSTEPRFWIDPRQNLAELAATGRVAVEVERLDGVYLLGASAVLPVSADALLDASLDFDRHVEMGIPNLRASRVVSVGRLHRQLSSCSRFGSWQPACVREGLSLGRASGHLDCGGESRGDTRGTLRG